MRKLSSKGLKYLKFLHLLGVIMWIGGALALIVILAFTHPSTPEGLYIRSRCVQLIDDILIIPGAIGLLITGIIYGVWSKWGFFKHRWITIKWIFNIFLAVLGGFALGEWVNNNVYPIEEIDNYLSTQVEFQRNVELSIFWGIVQVVFLIVVVWISVKKPWKRKEKCKT